MLNEGRENHFGSSAERFQPCNCFFSFRSAGEKNTFDQASFNTFDPGVHGWMAQNSAENGGPTGLFQPMRMPPADSLKHPTITALGQKDGHSSAMHAVKKRNLGDTSGKI